MVVRTKAAPPTPWSRDLAEPKIDESAYVHSFSNLIGDVKVDANVLIAPGTSIRADEGTPFYLGKGSNIQDGVVIHGLEKGRVIGDDGKAYSVWLGKETCITHLALIHGPAYIGDNCFVGFRSTVFNARVGSGCIIMMHALIQDVEIPPGKYVPSGAIITNQKQADNLPDVTSGDQKFAHHVVEINQALRVGYHCAEDAACINPIQDELKRSLSSREDHSVQSNHYEKSVGKMSVSSEIVEQVRSLLNQGYKVTTEHASMRRFKTKSWLTGSSLEGSNIGQVIGQLESTLAEHQGEYVRLIAVDTNSKSRVSELIIQRPDGSQPTQSKTSSVVSSFKTNPSKGVSTNGKVNLSGDLAQQVRSLLAQGCAIGAEHASQRRFKTKSWLTCPIIESKRESDVIRALEACMAEHSGEYVRLIGVDPNQKRRVAQTIIQRPDGIALNGGKTSSKSSYGSFNGVAKGSLNGDLANQVRSLLAQGCKIGTEHADKRRFKTKSWQSCAPIESTRESDVIRALEACMAEHSGEYIRLIGIDPNQKRRVAEIIIQRPDNKTPSLSSSSPKSGYSSYSSNGNGATASFSVGNSTLSSEAIAQVKSLLNQGCKISTEHADKRRFKTKSWQSCSPIESTRESDVIRALEACIADHSGEYVRLVGIDTQQKRRVAETIIQRP